MCIRDSGGRVPVADMVVTGHKGACVGEETGEIIVTVDMLGHAVDELHAAARLEADVYKRPTS